MELGIHTDTFSETVHRSSSSTQEEVKVEIDVEAMNREDINPTLAKVDFADPFTPVDHDDNIIDFDGPDDLDFTTMGGTWTSTIYNSGTEQVEARFGVSSEVAILGLTFYLLGNAFGPLLFAPLSEAHGRKISVLIPYFFCAIFSFGSAVAKDTQTLLITRFFAGVGGSAPLSNVGVVLADIWPPQHRGAALLSYGIAVISGPLIAPIVGGALVVNMEHEGWRWAEYVSGILILVILTADIFFIDESFPPVLLSRKASRMRKLTGNWALHTKHQETDNSLQDWMKKYMVVPLEMLVDPICFFINLYAAFVYAIIYLTIPVFPIEFQEVRGWNAVVGSLPFLALLVGVFFGAAILIWGWIAFCIGSACIGIGFFTIFQSSISYLVDTYLMQAASALAANMLLRSVLAGAFPLFADTMLTNLGIGWACSVLGFIAAGMIPIPFLFYIFGKRIRAWGKRSAQSL
ncbi:hypothetical protein UA08_08914 [Talaromyces atroroseus]|uniref:Major facilitator superfamily (MFS) profile domain-containing protein n=1 Tax=Talaromyces atroroseus TaxID=1441469 RepID=A0A225A7W8_TALAT|nr:hypothetical protein UA08_08914 [Talaromyces atroroseus]OKL55930.1 hypothetical protein UA08_08914 [Talaromyces atroroseus]